MMKTFLLAIVTVAFVSVSYASDLKSYASGQYTFEYPSSYSIKEPSPSSKVLVVQGSKGRVEVFKISDFGTRIHGFSSSGQDEFEAKLVPKEKIKKGEFEIWFFYLKTEV